MAWQAVMDANYTSVPLFPDDPEIILANGQFNTDVEVIIGTTSAEGIIFMIFYITNPSLWDDFRDEFDSNVVKWLFQLTRDPTAEEIQKAHQIINFYVGSIQNVSHSITEENIQGQGFIFHCQMILR